MLMISKISNFRIQLPNHNLWQFDIFPSSDVIFFVTPFASFIMLSVVMYTQTDKATKSKTCASPRSTHSLVWFVWKLTTKKKRRKTRQFLAFFGDGDDSFEGFEWWRVAVFQVWRWNGECCKCALMRKKNFFPRIFSHENHLENSEKKNKKFEKFKFPPSHFFASRPNFLKFSRIQCHVLTS